MTTLGKIEGKKSELNVLFVLNKKEHWYIAYKIKSCPHDTDQARLTELHRAEGLMPSTSDPESFSFWVWFLCIMTSFCF